jgi:hypothetical protein
MPCDLRHNTGIEIMAAMVKTIKSYHDSCRKHDCPVPYNVAKLFSPNNQAKPTNTIPQMVTLRKNDKIRPKTA